MRRLGHTLALAFPLTWLAACSATPQEAPSDSAEVALAEDIAPAVVDPWGSFATAPEAEQRRLVAERIAATRLDVSDLKACHDFFRSGDRREIAAAKDGAVQVVKAALALDARLAWAKQAHFELVAMRDLEFILLDPKRFPDTLIPTVFPLPARSEINIPRIVSGPRLVPTGMLPDWPRLSPIPTPTLNPGERWICWPRTWKWHRPVIWTPGPAVTIPPLEKDRPPLEPGDCVMPGPK